jgi:hypothetical protein
MGTAEDLCYDLGYMKAIKKMYLGTNLSNFLN